ncbi:hypothetical protein IV60_GL000612 [Lancefieldella rimae]|nr:hypothetical protein IV60_GL000612 [Lancefieldella rimae]
MMLAKQEREEIAKRAQRVNGKKERDNPYFVLTGDLIPNNTPVDDDYKKMSLVINDLCDTSDMVELPLDKNGVPIRIGDTVLCHGAKRTVKAIKIYETMTRIVYEIPEKLISWSSPELVTHADPISDHESIARAIEDITHCLNDAAASLKLQDIAMELRKLGGSND